VFKLRLLSALDFVILDYDQYNILTLSSNLDFILFKIKNLYHPNGMCASNVQLSSHSARFFYACTLYDEERAKLYMFLCSSVRLFTCSSASNVYQTALAVLSAHLTRLVQQPLAP